MTNISEGRVDNAGGGVAGARAAGARATGSILVIWNPDAGTDEAADEDLSERRRTIEAALQANAVDAELYESESEADTDRRVDAALGDQVGTIVAAGGDGTVRSIAFRLLERDVALGILPLGTAMNVARSLDIPLDLDGAAKVLAAGNVRSIDVGEARGRPFLEIASVGLGAEVLAGATEAGEGRFSRAFAILARAIRYPRTRVLLQLDGREVRGRAPSIAIANGRFTGRGLELVPDASLDDGRFDVRLYEGFGPLQLATHLARVVFGRAQDPRIRQFRAATVSIASHRPLPVRLDSKDVGTTPMKLVTRRAALRVIAPA